MDFLTWIRNQWDRAGAWVAIGVGALFLVAGWMGVSGTPYTVEQIPYVVSGGLGGIFLLGIGAMLWLSADLRDEWRKLDEIQQAIENEPEASPTESRLAEAPKEGDGAQNGARRRRPLAVGR